MKKLYQKSELWFAILFIIVYVVGASYADELSARLGTEKSVTLIFTAVLAFLLHRFIGKNGLSAYYGLCKPAHSPSRALFYLPLLLLSTVNLWFGARLSHTLPETLCYIGAMLLVGYLEEVIFRGLLFRAMARDGLRAAVIVSSLTFGIGHIVNLINGSGAELTATLCQVCYAVAIGFLFVTLFYRGGSLWPCILSHGVFNSLSVFSDQAASDRWLIPVSLALVVLSLGYALLLRRLLPQPALAEKNSI